MKNRLLLLLLVLGVACYAQPGKDGALTVSGSNRVLNRYCPVSADIAAGSATLAITTPSLLTLCPGDLIMVYQAQGVTMNTTNSPAYGNITAYNSAGLYEFKYVQAISGNVVTVQSAFANAYAWAGKTQVIKVPQYTTLTINAGASLVARPWKDTLIASTLYRIGGLVVVHATAITNNGTITATDAGFRGGAFHSSPAFITGITDYVSTNLLNGGEKGEGIGGAPADYLTGRYCMGAPANGGGGANVHNAGGGGGANGFNGNTWTGEGIMIVNANNPLVAWSLSQAYITNSNALTNSSGGGRGGYSVGNFNANALVDPPGSSIWQVDNRREVGGIGGRPLTNIDPETRIYFGGGGGAPDANNNASASASNGGGIVYLISTGGINGSGYITADGKNASNTNPVCSCDGAPGAGAGGSIVIKTSAISSTQLLTANGGNGGNQLAINAPGDPVNESEGPGGGGGGGFVAVSSTAIVPSVNGGLNGTTLSGAVTEMISNGATQGAMGQTLPVTTAFISYTGGTTPSTTIINPVCQGASINFTSNASSTYSWYGPDGFTSTTQNPTLTNVTPDLSGIYSVTLSTAGCPGIQTQSFSVTINPSPTVTVNNASVCPGVAGTLTANGAASYSWENGAFFGNPYTVTLFSNTLYTVTGTSAAGCTASAVSSVVVYALPSLSVVPNNISCAGPGSATVTTSGGSGPFSYSWMPTAQTTSVATNVYPGAYTVTVLDNGTGCSALSSGSFTSSVPFTGTVMTNSISCNGNATGTASINLSGGSGTQSYAWSDMSGLQTTATATNLSGGPHTVTVTDGTSLCSFTQGFTIFQPAPFSVNITASSPTACTNSTINLTATASGGTPAYGYTWSPGPTTNTNTATYATAGSYPYTVTSTDAHNCVAIKTITLTFATTPTVSASSATICQGAVATLTASGAAMYLWYPSGTNGATFTTSPAASSVYTVIGISQSCTGQATAAVLVNPLPVPAIAVPNPTLCNGQLLLFSGSGIGNYAWSGPAGFTSTAQNPSVNPVTSSNSGAYHLTLTSAEGCTASATRIITVLPNPLPVTSGATVCIGEGAQLSASGGVDYVWSGPGGFFASSQNIYIPIVTPAQAGNYVVAVTGTNGCTSFSVVPLVGNAFPLPSPTITTGPVTCVNSPVSLHGSGGEIYSWHGPAGFVSTSANPVFTPTGMGAAGIYTLSVKNSNNCSNFTTVMINLFAQPKGSVSGITKFCLPACSDLQFNPAENVAPVSGYTFQVNTKVLSDSVSSYCFNTAGTYTVKAIFKDTNSCVNTASLLVTAYNKPSADFEFFPVNPLVGTDHVLFTNTSAGADVNGWNWFFSGTQGDTIRTKNTSHVFETPGNYAIAMIVKNKWGCADTMIKTISIGEEFSLYVPNAFTPNGDAVNDVFQPKGLGIQKYRLLIFDRWGANLFESTDFYTGWNGRYRNSDCTDDVYVWKIDVILNGGRSKSLTGYVSLIR